MKWGLAERIIKLSQNLVGRIRGSMGVVTVVASILFGAIVGSTMATVAGIGSVMIPEMERTGYDRRQATALATASSFLGILIPPSISSLIYCMVTGVSVGALFLATVLPGFVLASGYICINYVLIGRSLPLVKVDKGVRIFNKETRTSLFQTSPILFMPVLILGGIYGGIFTPTEAGAVGVVYSLALAFMYRLFPLKTLGNILIASAETNAVVLILVPFAAPMGRIFSIYNISDKLAQAITSLTTNPNLIILLISLIILVLGMFLESTAITLITVPVFLPLLVQFGFDPIHFGSVMVLNLGIGMLSPPFGYALFMGAKIGDLEVHELVKPLIPYIIWATIVLLIIMYVPDISLWLPKVLIGYTP